MPTTNFHGFYFLTAQKFCQCYPYVHWSEDIPQSMGSQPITTHSKQKNSPSPGISTQKELNKVIIQFFHSGNLTGLLFYKSSACIHILPLGVCLSDLIFIYILSIHYYLSLTCHVCVHETKNIPEKPSGSSSSDRLVSRTKN